MRNKGYSAMITLLVVGALILSIGMSVVLSSIDLGQGALGGVKKEVGLGVAEACAEEVLLRINETNSAGGDVTLPEGICAVTINSQVGSAWDFTVSVNVGGYRKNIRVSATRDSTVTIVSWKEI